MHGLGIPVASVLMLATVTVVSFGYIFLSRTLTRLDASRADRVITAIIALLWWYTMILVLTVNSNS